MNITEVILDIFWMILPDCYSVGRRQKNERDCC